jgi:hypothetical protein
VANDDWRIRVALASAERAHGVVGRLHGGLGSEAAKELAADLEGRRLAVSRDGSIVFVYTATQAEAEQALAIVQSELAEDGFEAVETKVEHWLHDEERWDDEPRGETWEEEQVDRGYAPWEVRIQCDSHRAANELADRIEGEGYSVVRRHSFVVAGADSEEEARELAGRVGGEVEAGGELVWENMPSNPFAVFGGLGG